MRVNVENVPNHPDNEGIVVSHVGLNIDRHWHDFRGIDGGDQQMIHGWLEAEEVPAEGDGTGRRRRLRPDFEVTREIVDRFVSDPFLDPTDDAFIDHAIATLREQGVDLETLRLTREDLKGRARPLNHQDPWRLIDEADELDLGPKRTRLLRDALAELDDQELAVLQGRAVALAMLAFDDRSEFARAKEACETAETAAASVVLPYSFLAEAFLRAQEWDEALDVSARIDTKRLDEIDLHWRVVRLDEIRAACFVRLGRFEEAELPIGRILRELVEEGEDFLPSPVELLAALTDAATDATSPTAQKAKTIITRFASRLPLHSWAPPELVDRMKDVCELGT
jgi:hypothetical protein